MRNKVKDMLGALIGKSMFPNDKNRIWSMCRASLYMTIKCMEEAEKCNMTNEQFFISWEDCINQISCKDHTTNKSEDFEKTLKEFYVTK